MKIYIAGSSAEIARAKTMRMRLLAEGHEVISTWIEVIEGTGSDANPRDATVEQRRAWAQKDLEEVAVANVLLYLVPTIKPSFGAGFECGAAFTICSIRTSLTDATIGIGSLVSQPILVSVGDTKQSIFCALGIELESDDDVLPFLKELHDLAHTAP